MNLQKLKISGGLIALAFLYLYFSSPEKVVVDEQGNINGLINNARESIQGKAFWRNQLIKVSSELEWELGEPQRQAKFNQKMNQMMREVNQSMEEMHKKYPDTRPSAAERQADALRERADQIERRELDRYFEKLRIERVSELRKILPIVKARAE